MQDNEAWGRRFRALEKRAEKFKDTYGKALGLATPEQDSHAPRALFISSAPPRTETELCLMKALAVAGWVPIPLIMMQPDVLKTYYSLISLREIHEWAAYLPDPKTFADRAEVAIASCRSIEELQAFEVDGVRVGGNAISFARRLQRIGTLDFSLEAIRKLLVTQTAHSMAAAHAAAAVIAATSPRLVLAVDTVYTPKGEIFDTALATGIPFVRWYPAHKSNALMLKRYTIANRDSDLNSLSEVSWRRLKNMTWYESYRRNVEDELRTAYSNGDWYGESATQFDRLLVDADGVRQALGIDGSKKLAVIFAHIVWDASFGRGRDLFSDYEEWLVETVRAACANTQLQWLIKVHPAHAGKNEIDFWRGEPSEVRILRERVGVLPPHVKVIPAETKISTYSLFPLMDWGLTIRGTPGLEAARLGVPVLTGGTGRYDRKGFTIDSQTPEEYLGKIAQLHEIPRLSPEQVELANRYAFGLFRSRPLPLSTITLEYGRKYGAEEFFNGVHIRNQTLEDWIHAPDLNAFADWATWSEAEDFLLPPVRACEPSYIGHDAASVSRFICGSSVQHSNAQLVARLRQLEDSLAEKDAQINLITVQCAEAERRREAIETAMFWRASYPLRLMITRCPPGLRRAGRGAAKLAWWSITLQLPSKLRQRPASSRGHAAKTGTRRPDFFRSVLTTANIFAISRLPHYVVDRLVIWLPDYALLSLPGYVVDKLSDYAAVNVKYFWAFRKFPNLKSPETFNEKIAWRKLFQRNPKFTIFSDKIEVKAEVAKLIGEQHIIETLWVGDTPERIPFDKLEPPYVIKVNHRSSDHIFVRTQQDLNKERIIQSMNEQLRDDYGHRRREWAYVDIRRRVLIERMIETARDNTPEDYKFYVYHGCVHLIEVYVDRLTSLAMNTYNRKWELLPLDSGYPNIPRPFAKPLNLEQMIEIAEKIGGQFDFARVDLYSPPQGILFGEVTFYPGAGHQRYPEEFGKPWRVSPSRNGKRLLDRIQAFARA